MSSDLKDWCLRWFQFSFFSREWSHSRRLLPLDSNQCCSCRSVLYFLNGKLLGIRSCDSPCAFPFFFVFFPYNCKNTFGWETTVPQVSCGYYYLQGGTASFTCSLLTPWSWTITLKLQFYLCVCSISLWVTIHLLQLGKNMHVENTEGQTEQLPKRCRFAGYTGFSEVPHFSTHRLN